MEKVTFDLFEENKENKRQIEEATSKTKSQQCELLEANKMNILLKQKTDDYDLANKTYHESLTKNRNQIKEQAEVEKLVKQFQVRKVEIDVQLSKTTQLIEAVDGKQHEML